MCDKRYYGKSIYTSKMWMNSKEYIIIPNIYNIMVAEKHCHLTTYKIAIKVEALYYITTNNGVENKRLFVVAIIVIIPVLYIVYN